MKTKPLVMGLFIVCCSWMLFGKAVHAAVCFKFYPKIYEHYPENATLTLSGKIDRWKPVKNQNSGAISWQGHLNIFTVQVRVPGNANDEKKKYFTFSQDKSTSNWDLNIGSKSSHKLTVFIFGWPEKPDQLTVSKTVDLKTLRETNYRISIEWNQFSVDGKITRQLYIPSGQQPPTINLYFDDKATCPDWVGQMGIDSANVFLEFIDENGMIRATQEWKNFPYSYSVPSTLLNNQIEFNQVILVTPFFDLKYQKAKLASPVSIRDFNQRVRLTANKPGTRFIVYHVKETEPPGPNPGLSVPIATIKTDDQAVSLDLPNLASGQYKLVAYSQGVAPAVTTINLKSTTQTITFKAPKPLPHLKIGIPDVLTTVVINGVVRFNGISDSQGSVFPTDVTLLPKDTCEIKLIKPGYREKSQIFLYEDIHDSRPIQMVLKPINRKNVVRIVPDDSTERRFEGIGGNKESLLLTGQNSTNQVIFTSDIANSDFFPTEVVSYQLIDPNHFFQFEPQHISSTSRESISVMPIKRKITLQFIASDSLNQPVSSEGLVLITKNDSSKPEIYTNIQRVGIYYFSDVWFPLDTSTGNTTPITISICSKGWSSQEYPIQPILSKIPLPKHYIGQFPMNQSIFPETIIVISINEASTKDYWITAKKAVEEVWAELKHSATIRVFLSRQGEIWEINKSELFGISPDPAATNYYIDEEIQNAIRYFSSSTSPCMEKQLIYLSRNVGKISAQIPSDISFHIFSPDPAPYPTRLNWHVAGSPERLTAQLKQLIQRNRY